MKNALLISISVLALAACNQNAGNSAATNTAAADSATNAAAPASATASSNEQALPPPRAGLWEITTTTTPARQGGRGPMGPIRSCSDGTTPARMGMGAARDPNACQTTMERGAGGVINTTSHCTMGPGIEVNTTSRITGDNQTGYQVHSESDVTGAPMPAMNGHRVTEINARYAGACPENMPPGSIEIGGRVITREQMEAMRGQRGAGGGGGGGL